MQEVPPPYEVIENTEEEDNPDKRLKSKTRNGDGDRRAHDAELYDQVD